MKPCEIPASATRMQRCCLLTLVFAAMFTTWARAESPPAGSYSKTCRSTSVRGTTLVSSCRERGGRYKNTSLSSFDLCIGDIKNDNGNLQCSKGNKLVEGSYSRTCRESRMDGEVLHSSCKEIGGRYVSSQLDVNGCRGDVGNINGVLTCPKGDSNPPAGSYMLTCRDIVTSGGTLSAKCANLARAYKQSSLQFASCPPNTIMNDNGTLRCTPKPPINNQPSGPTFLTICTGAPVPSGYVIVDQKFDPTSCGNPTSNNLKNIQTLERYDNLPIGKAIDICVGQPTPPGWAVTSTRWNPQTCSQPTSSELKNVETIQRTS